MISSKNAKKQNSSVPSVSITLPASVGSVKSQRARKQRKQRNTASGDSVPMAVSYRNQTYRPTFLQPTTADGRVRVRHREFISDVSGAASGAYLAKSIPLNPGLKESFPWLSGLATSFESYTVKSMRFEYQPIVGTIESGMVMLAVDYDAADPAPGSKVEFMQTFGATRSTVWSSCTVVCTPQNLNKLPQRYTRKSPWAGNGDIKTYDLGVLHIATEGQATNSVKGEIYVCYDIELITPQPVLFAPEQFSAKATKANGSAAQPFLGATVETGASGYELVSFSPVNSLMEFKKAGEYLLDYAINAPNVNLGTGTLTFTDPSANISWSNLSTARTADFLSQSFRVNVPSLPANMLVSLSNTGNPTNSVMRMCPYEYSLL